MLESPRARRRDAGFTLMELMVVMVIMVTLMGMGTGLFMSMGKRTATESALANLQALIVGVRNNSSRFPSMIVVDTEKSEVQGLAQEVRQELHFDPRALPGAGTIVENGIEGRDCNLGGAQVDPTGGRIGGGLRLGGGRVDCGNYAAYDVTDGMTVELYMKLDSVGACDLVTKGSMLTVRLESATRLSASITLKDEHGVEKITNAATIPAVRPQEWVGVRVSYDRNALMLYTDSGFGWVPRGTPRLADRRVGISSDAALSVGGFSGMLDDFRLAGVHATEPLQMPPGVKLIGKKPFPPIHFEGGRLDPSVHMGAASIVIEAQGRRTTLEIATNGALSVFYSDAAAPIDEKRPDQKPPQKKE